MLSTHLQALKEELLQEVVPHSQGALQQPLTHSAPVLTDGLGGQEVPYRVSDGRQPLQALYIDQKAADATADVLLTAESQRKIQKSLKRYLMIIDDRLIKSHLFYCFSREGTPSPCTPPVIRLLQDHKTQTG